MNGYDSHERTLSPGERQQHDRLLPALQAWTAYLSATATAPTGRFEDAEQRRSAVLLQHRGVKSIKGPVAVCPVWAHEWAMANGHRGSPGTGVAMTAPFLSSALDFMRATPAVTFRPLLDHHGRRRRDGFYHLTGEMHTRLWSGCYVPVLTPRPGRPLTNDRVPPVRTSGGRAMRQAGGDRTIDIVRDWVRVNPVTALRGTALREGRPLAVRSSGRPSTSMTGGPQVARSHVLGTVGMLVRHAVEHAGRGGWRLPSEAEVFAALASHAEATPHVVSPVTRFTTPDAPQQRHLRDWWRFNLTALGRGPIDPVELLPEIAHWQAMQRPVAEPVATSAPGKLPPGVNLADLTPEERDFYDAWGDE